VLKLLFLLSSISAVYAGIDPKLVGEWVTTAPGTGNRVVLKSPRTAAAAWVRILGSASRCLRLLVVATASGPATTYSYQIQNEKLTVAGGGLAQALVFEKSAGELAPTAPAVVPVPDRQAAPAQAVRSAGRYAHPYWGLSFAVPGAWKANEREGLLLLGSDTEAGLIIVRFVRSTNRQTMLAEYSKGLAEDGITLIPATRAEDYAAGSNRGLGGELSGAGKDGSRIRARVIGIQSQFGDAAVLLGLTTDDKYPGVKARVEEIAASIEFSAPKIPPANQIVAGNYVYFYISSNGSYSREDKLLLCANGVFSRGGEMYGTGSAGSAAVQNANSGSWERRWRRHGRHHYPELPQWKVGIAAIPKIRLGYRLEWEKIWAQRQWRLWWAVIFGSVHQPTK